MSRSSPLASSVDVSMAGEPPGGSLASGGRLIMSSVSLAALAFVCPLLGAAVGMTLRTRLPQHHLNRDSTDVIKLATGLVATLVALVLSLLISSANSTRVSVENEYTEALADVVLLDRYLVAYGP